MPPRHAYWTILVDNQPTAFRAHDPAELLATLNRLREKHPSAVMKWFERGQLFDSREQAREQGLGKGERRWEGQRPSDDSGERRGPDWRPGGEHRDARQKYKDAKKAKWQRFKQKIRSQWADKHNPPPDPESFSPPHGDPLRDQIDDEPRSRRRREDREGEPPPPHGDPMRPGAARPTVERGWKPKGPPRGDRARRDEGGGWRDRQGSGAPPRAGAGRGTPGGGWRDENRGRGGWKPKGPPRERRDDRDRRDDRHRTGGDWRERPREERPEYRGKPGSKRGGNKSFRSRSEGPAGDSNRFGDRKPWGSRPGGGKSFASRGPRRPPGGGGRRGPMRGPKKPRGDDE